MTGSLIQQKNIGIGLGTWKTIHRDLGEHGDLQAKEIDLEETSLTIVRKSQLLSYLDLRPQFSMTVRWEVFTL